MSSGTPNDELISEVLGSEVHNEIKDVGIKNNKTIQRTKLLGQYQQIVSFPSQ